MGVDGWVTRAGQVAVCGDSELYQGVFASLVGLSADSRVGGL
jgi:hypothetical protein